MDVQGRNAHFKFAIVAVISLPTLFFSISFNYFIVFYESRTLSATCLISFSLSHTLTHSFTFLYQFIFADIRSKAFK